jgi:hypothetical protein
VSWNQTLYNVIEREGNETQGFLNDIREHLRVIREYINLLTEVTIQFDEFSAGYMKADVGTMQDIERNLRRQAFGG